MSSGVWLPAEQVAAMSSMAMREMIMDWQREREAIITVVQKTTRWSWFLFRFVEVEQSREEAEKSVSNVLNYFITSPTRHKGYNALNQLCITAINAEQLVPGGQIFTSTKDFAHIAPFIDGK